MAGKAGAPQHRWTAEERSRLAEVAPGRSHGQIREVMTAEFGDHFGGTRISAALKRYGIRTGLTGRFEKGNAGGFYSEEQKRKFLEAGKKTRFAKGNMPHNAVGKPVGYERVDAKDGYVWVKVKDGRQVEANDNFRPKHHVVYEQAHGAIPDGCNVVFADHDRRNFDPDNLVAVPRDLWCVITHRHMAYWDRRSLEAAMAIAKVDRARYALELHPRECRRCGCTFVPRFSNQRTCDGCLAWR